MEILLLPFLACAALTAIHVTLGHHVLERGVIFVDLSLAQVASLGAVAAFMLGLPFHGPASYFISLGSAFIGATLFSLLRRTKNPVHQEAMIGVVYVVAASVTIILLNFAPMEAGRVKEMLVGNILFVQSAEVVKICILYIGVGLFHWFFRRKLLLVSTKPDQARRRGLSVRLWDFLFYASFALVVTSSVEIAGVLLVFAFLIIPILSSTFLAKGVRPRLFLGWIMGVFGSALGLLVSYQADLPTGAAVVCALAIFLPVSFVMRFFLRKAPKS